MKLEQKASIERSSNFIDSKPLYLTDSASRFIKKYQSDLLGKINGFIA